MFKKLQNFCSLWPLWLIADAFDLQAVELRLQTQIEMHVKLDFNKASVSKATINILIFF